MAADEWYVHSEEGGSVGPVKWAQLAKGVKHGKVPLDAFVRRPSEQWRRASDIPQLVKLAQSKTKTKTKKKRSAPKPAKPAFESGIAYEDARIRAAAVYCSDGRWGEQIDDFLHNSLRLPRYDRLCIPGGSACLAGHLTAFLAGRDAQDHLAFLIKAHELESVVLIAHEGCAYYLNHLRVKARDLDSTQRSDLKKAADRIRGLGTLEVQCYVARRADAKVRFERT